MILRKLDPWKVKIKRDFEGELKRDPIMKKFV